MEEGSRELDFVTGSAPPARDGSEVPPGPRTRNRPARASRRRPQPAGVASETPGTHLFSPPFSPPPPRTPALTARPAADHLGNRSRGEDLAAEAGRVKSSPASRCASGDGQGPRVRAPAPPRRPAAPGAADPRVGSPGRSARRHLGGRATPAHPSPHRGPPRSVRAVEAIAPARPTAGCHPHLVTYVTMAAVGDPPRRYEGRRTGADRVDRSAGLKFPHLLVEVRV